ncbi:hypothetical protein [Actinokineospora sp.]
MLLFAIESPSATEELWLNIGVIGSLVAAVVVGLVALRNRRR